MRKAIPAIAALLLSILPVCAQPKVVGHRGCRFNTPSEPVTPLYENTIAALEYAQGLGIYAAEFDVQLTADDKVIVFHGPAVPNTGKSINKMTFDEARAVTLPGGHKMPTLEEYFSKAKEHPQMRIICEIKKQSSPERETSAVEQVMSLAAEMQLGEQIEYTTFSEWMCAEIHRIDPEAKVIYLDSGVFVKTPEYAAEKGYNGISYDFNGFLNHPDYVRRAKNLGIETTLWLVNDCEVVEWAIKHGIDFISSDHPEIIKDCTALKNKKHRK